MGTIANKLNKIKNIKDKIKTITNLSTINTITSETIFKDYPKQILKEYIKIINNGTDELYTNFPKIEDEGTKLELNTEKGPLKITLEGNTSQDGTPTPDTPIPIKVVTNEQNINIQNKNLLNVLNFNSTFANVKVTTNPDKSITLNGTASSNYAINIITNWSLSLKSGKSYILSGCPNLGGKNVLSVELYSSSPTNQYITDTGNGKSFTLTTDRKYRCYIAIKSGQTYNNVKIYPMLREISTTSLFEPYQSQTYPLSLGNIELARIGNYKDYIFKNEVGSPYYNVDLDLNDWYLHKEIIGENLWEKDWVYENASSTPVPRTVLRLRNMNTIHVYFSNCFLSSEMNNQQIANRLKTDGLNWFLALANNLTGIEATDSNDIKLNKIITYLQNVSANIYYVLATPTNTKITDTTLISQLENMNNNARSYKDTTIIECTSLSEDNETIQVSTTALKNIN